MKEAFEKWKKKKFPYHYFEPIWSQMVFAKWIEQAFKAGAEFKVIERLKKTKTHIEAMANIRKELTESQQRVAELESSQSFDAGMRHAAEIVAKAECGDCLYFKDPEIVNDKGFACCECIVPELLSSLPTDNLKVAVEALEKIQHECDNDLSGAAKEFINQTLKTIKESKS